jgi:hypothetical protein
LVNGDDAQTVVADTVRAAFGVGPFLGHVVMAAAVVAKQAGNRTGTLAGVLTGLGVPHDAACGAALMFTQPDDVVMAS